LLIRLPRPKSMITWRFYFWYFRDRYCSLYSPQLCWGLNGRSVIKWWDKLDANRERRERDHEKGRSVVPLEWGTDEPYLSDRPSYDTVLRRLMLAGDFIDLIFDCPETLHELVTDADLSRILKDLKPHLKNMLYYLFLHDYSAAEYAENIGQSDRNIRGIRETALKKIRKLYGGILAYRQENSLPMTIDEKYFLNNGVRKKKDSRQLDR